MPWQSGRIIAIAYNNDTKVAEHELITAGNPHKIMLNTDKEIISTDNDDVCHIEGVITDSLGNPCPLANNEITFNLKSGGVILAVENGNLNDHYNPKGNVIKAYKGRSLLIVQSDGKPGKIEIEATSGELEKAMATIKVR